MDNLSYKKPVQTTWEKTVNSLRKGKQVTFYYKGERFNAQRPRMHYFIERVKTGQIGEAKIISSSTDLLGIAACLMNTNELTKTFD